MDDDIGAAGACCARRGRNGSGVKAALPPRDRIARIHTAHARHRAGHNTTLTSRGPLADHRPHLLANRLKTKAAPACHMPGSSKETRAVFAPPTSALKRRIGKAALVKRKGKEEVQTVQIALRGHPLDQRPSACAACFGHSHRGSIVLKPNRPASRQCRSTGPRHDCDPPRIIEKVPDRAASVGKTACHFKCALNVGSRPEPAIAPIPATLKHWLRPIKAGLATIICK